MEDLKAFVGKAINMSRLSTMCTPHDGSCTIGNYEYMYQKRFGVTDALLQYWERCGVELMLYLELDDGVIAELTVDKGRNSDTPRPVWTGLKEKPQELRVVRRLLEWLTTE